MLTHDLHKLLDLANAVATDQIHNTRDLVNSLERIALKPSCIDFDWTFEYEEIFEKDGKLRGWLINTTFQRPNTATGKIERGRGRQEIITVGTSFSSLVKTAWLLVKLIVEHELHEAFCVTGSDGIARRVFDPHADVEALSRVGRTDEAPVRVVPVTKR